MIVQPRGGDGREIPMSVASSDALQSPTTKEEKVRRTKTEKDVEKDNSVERHEDGFHRGHQLTC